MCIKRSDKYPKVYSAWTKFQSLPCHHHAHTHIHIHTYTICLCLFYNYLLNVYSVQSWKDKDIKGWYPYNLILKQGNMRLKGQEG